MQLLTCWSSGQNVSALPKWNDVEPTYYCKNLLNTDQSAVYTVWLVTSAVKQNEMSGANITLNMEIYPTVVK